MAKRRRGKRHPEQGRAYSRSQIEQLARAAHYERKTQMSQQKPAAPKRVAEITVHLRDQPPLKLTNVLFTLEASPVGVLMQLMAPDGDKTTTLIPVNENFLYCEIVPPKVEIALAGQMPAEKPQE